jgi:hypothetical protein
MCAQQVLIRKNILKPGDPDKIKLIATVPFEELSRICDNSSYQEKQVIRK